MSEYTKGEWKAVLKGVDGQGYIEFGPIVDGEMDDIGFLYGHELRPNAEADAAMISACTNMYEALRDFIDESDKAGCNADIIDTFHVAYPKLKIALAKAEGKE
jgi:hypothetical protein